MAASIFRRAQDEFIKHLSQEEENDFKSTDLGTLHQVILKLQKEQQEKRAMKYMKRLDPFLKSMERYGQVVETFLNISNMVAFIWGPMKFILLTANMYTDAFNAVLDAYQDIGEQIPLLTDFEIFASNTHMMEILGLIYTDILEFHREALRFFRKSCMSSANVPSLAHANPTPSSLDEESRASIMEFQEIRAVQQKADDQLALTEKAQEEAHRSSVKSWLSGFSNEGEQDCHRQVRSLCPGSGRWLFGNPCFQRWLDLNYCDTPLIWLTGIPGAGKTILASVVIDELISKAKNKDIAIAYFFCKYGDKSRNSFLAILRSLLIQLLPKTPDLLSYIYEKAAMSSDSVLSSPELAKDLLEILINNCAKNRTIFLVLDGIDECENQQRKEIACWFQARSDALPANEQKNFRCLFVSQDDGVSRKWFNQLPKITISSVDSKADIKDFATVWHKRIEEKFGELRTPGLHIANIVSARSQGMFLFAKLMLQYLEDQPSRESLVKELDPSKFPVRLNEAYDRIMQRMLEFRSRPMQNEIRKVLGWIVCSPRPLRWREIQGAICINLDAEITIIEQQLLETPKSLFAAFIEMRPNGMVDLVHSTAREYLIQSEYVQVLQVHRSLAILSMGFLSMPQVSASMSQDEISTELLNGVYAFLDYSSACWAFHLQAGIPKKSSEAENQELRELGETLETFTDIHESPNSKKIAVPKPLQQALAKLLVDANSSQAVQAVAWSLKQIGMGGQSPCTDEALDLWEIIASIRNVLEASSSSSVIPGSACEKSLRQYYGDKLFKCTRVSCYYYHEGFSTFEERRRHTSKHDLPFLCIVLNCPHATFGYDTQAKLKKHLFEFHAIDMIEETEFPPLPQLPQATSSNDHPPGLTCRICGKGFTRGHNLKNHERSHAGQKEFKCGKCDSFFVRQGDRKRHEDQHEGEKRICFGVLDDGTEWGCKAEFSRQDKREAHFRKAGKKCIMPLLKERLRKNRDAGLADTDGPDELFSEGRVVLPRFKEFLRICDLLEGEEIQASE
ncbi:unnamed protein product [Clonostachys solani]|uniref:Zinc finger protein n=1 Tax=Clonostachys solani TaxID=160281 RepID=A0A9P0E7U6_9HYPO|nr:unnamed protein product [Clonostachys solani]